VCKYALIELGATDVTKRAYFGKSPVKILRKVVQIYHSIEKQREAGTKLDEEEDEVGGDAPMHLDGVTGLPVFRARRQRALRCPPLPAACAVERNASRQEILDCNYEALKELGGSHAQSVHGPWGDQAPQHLAHPFRTDTETPASRPTIVHPSETAATLQRAANAVDALKEMAQETDDADDDEVPAAERQHDLAENGDRDGTQETALPPARALDRRALLSLGVRMCDDVLLDKDGARPHWCGVSGAYALGCQCQTCAGGRLPSDSDINRFSIDELGAWEEEWSILKGEYAMEARVGDVVISPSVGRIMNVAVGGVYRADARGGPYLHTVSASNLRGVWAQSDAQNVGFDFSVPTGAAGKATVLLQGRLPTGANGAALLHVHDERLVWSQRTTQAGDFRARADVRVWMCTRDAALPPPSFVQDWHAVSWLALPQGARGLAPDTEVFTEEMCPTEAQYARSYRQQKGQRMVDKNLQILCMDYGEASHFESAMADKQVRQTVLSGGILHQEFAIGSQLATPPWDALPCEEIFVKGLGANRTSVYKYYTSPAKKRARFVHSHGVVAYALALYIVRLWLKRAEATDGEYVAALRARREAEPALGPREKSDSGIAMVRSRATNEDAEGLLAFLKGTDWALRTNRQLWHLCEFIYNRAQMVHLTMAQATGDYTAHRAFMNRLKLLVYCSDAHPLKQREFTSLDCQQAQIPAFYDDIIARDVELTTYRDDGLELLSESNHYAGKSIGALPGDVVHEVGIGATKGKDPRTARDVGMITACMAMSTQDGALAEHESKQYEYHHRRSTEQPSFTSSVGACSQYIEDNLDEFFKAQEEVPEPCLRPRQTYGMMRALHHIALRKTGRKPPVERRKPHDDAWHSIWSVWSLQAIKAQSKGYKNCQKRECFDPDCQRGSKCPKSLTQMRKAQQYQQLTGAPSAGSGASASVAATDGAAP